MTLGRLKILATPELVAAWALCELERQLDGAPSHEALLRFWRAVTL